MLTFLSKERCDEEFQQALEQMDKLRISHEDYHRLNWELHQRMSEIADLQRALSDAQSYLFEERKQLLKVIAENDALRGTSSKYR